MKSNMWFYTLFTVFNSKAKNQMQCLEIKYSLWFSRHRTTLSCTLSVSYNTVEAFSPTLLYNVVSTRRGLQAFSSGSPQHFIGVEVWTLDYCNTGSSSFLPVFLILLPWSLTFNIQSEAGTVWDVALGLFILFFSFPFFVVSLSISWSEFRVNLLKCPLLAR